MRCIKCGRECSVSAKFCIACGEKINRNTDVKKLLPKFMVAGAGIIAVVGIAVCHISGNGTQVGDDSQAVISDTIEAVPPKDMHSIWFDGVEMKVLEYLDDADMVVKFCLDDYMVQAVVPRTLEEEQYKGEYYIEEYGDGMHAYLKLTNYSKEDAVYFAYIQQTGMVEEYEHTYLEMTQEDNGVSEIQIKSGQAGIVEEAYERVVLSEYDKDENGLSGYMAIVPNSENDMVFVMEVLNDTEVEEEQIKENFEQLVIREVNEQDFVMDYSLEQTEYDTRMDSMYKNYAEIAFTPDSYLQENYQAPGEQYSSHYLIDMTGEGIPEIVFVGRPNWICIMGEKNAVNVAAAEIRWAEEPDIFYTRLTYTGDETWTKYELMADAEGFLTVNILESEYLHSYSNEYSYCGNPVSEEEYQERLLEITNVKLQMPKLYYSDEYIAGKSSFKKSVWFLTDEFLMED